MAPATYEPLACKTHDWLHDTEDLARHCDFNNRGPEAVDLEVRRESARIEALAFRANASKIRHAAIEDTYAALRRAESAIGLGSNSLALLHLKSALAALETACKATEDLAVQA